MKHTKLTRACFYICSLLLSTLLTVSCGSSKMAVKQQVNNYSGVIYLKDGSKKVGMVGIPSANSKDIYIEEADVANATPIYVEGDKIDRIEYTFGTDAQKVYTMRQLPYKDLFSGNALYWVLCISEGPNVSAYIGAANYYIRADGTIALGGTKQVIQHSTGGSAVIQPSFPVYMIKKGEKALSLVTLKDGIGFEASSFRTGVSRFLADDAKLCEYVRQQKWGFDNIATIVQNYIPNRGQAELTVDGKIVSLQERSLFTEALDEEIIWTVETAFPSNSAYSMQFGIGIRSTLAKFFTYGFDVGYAKAKYIDSNKRIGNHAPDTWDTAPAIDADFSEQGLFRANGSVGGQLPFDFGKIYLIPGAHLGFGATLATEYNTFYYGPMATLDVAIKLQKGGLLVIGGGYRRNICGKSSEGKEEASVPGFKAYEPYNNLLVRVGYKF